jgi:hypothetical protein
MSSRNLLALALAIATACPSMVCAASQQTSHTQFKGLTAETDFDIFDPSGCVETFVTVIAIDGSIKLAPGHPAVASGMIVFVSQMDNCTQTQLILADGSAPLASEQLQISSSLKTASLTATGGVFDLVSNNTLPVTISLAWVGTGQLGGFEEHSNFRQPAFGLRSTIRNSGTFRPATAVGTVMVNGSNIVSGTTTGALSSTKQGEVDISH